MHKHEFTQSSQIFPLTISKISLFLLDVLQWDPWWGLLVNMSILSRERSQKPNIIEQRTISPLT